MLPRKGIRNRTGSERFGGQVIGYLWVSRTCIFSQTTRGPKLVAQPGRARQGIRYWKVLTEQMRPAWNPRPSEEGWDTFRLSCESWRYVVWPFKLILATGARWRDEMNVPGASSSIASKGVHCPHLRWPSCSKGKRRKAVTGGGQLGYRRPATRFWRASSSTSPCCEFADTLARPMKYWQRKARSMPKHQDHKSAQTTEVRGDGNKGGRPDLHASHHARSKQVDCGWDLRTDRSDPQHRLASRGRVGNAEQSMAKSRSTAAAHIHFLVVFAAGDVTTVACSSRFIIAMGAGSTPLLWVPF